MTERLFSGTPELLGGLSNEAELAKLCPAEFSRDNPWSHAAMAIFYEGGNIKHWKYRSEDPATIRKQRACFVALISTFGIKHEDKEAVSGWMLSAMLTEVPVHVPKSS